MKEINIKRQKDIIVNARFLTRHITGLERYAIEISRQLKKIQPSLTFIAPDDILHRSAAKELGVELYGKLKGHFWEQIELPFLLRQRNRPLLINLMNTGPMWYRNQITVIHDVAFLRNPKWFSRRAAAWFKFLVPRVIDASSLIVTDSDFTKKELVELLEVPIRKIYKVYPGVSEAFNSSREKRHGIKKDITILAVSMLEPRKNLKKLIEGFKIAGLKNSKLIIAGGDNQLVFGKNGKPNIDVKYPSIVFLGYVTDAQLLDLYKQADVFVSVSLYEGFGFPPLEAFASGCKVLVSDIPSHHEIFGDCVVYVNPLNSEEIAHKLKSVVELNNKVSKSEVEKILKRFNWLQAAEELLNIAETAQKVN